MEFLRKIHLSHERLKHRIHTGWRYPLPPWGRATMGFVYFLIPVIAGSYIMQWAISKSHASIGERGEKLVTQKQEGMVGDRRPDGAKVGAGGLGGGAKLVTSDQETQEKNRKQLKKLFKQLKKQQQRQQQSNKGA